MKRLNLKSFIVVLFVSTLVSCGASNSSGDSASSSSSTKSSSAASVDLISKLSTQIEYIKNDDFVKGNYQAYVTAYKAELDGKVAPSDPWFDGQKYYEYGDYLYTNITRSEEASYQTFDERVNHEFPSASLASASYVSREVVLDEFLSLITASSKYQIDSSVDSNAKFQVYVQEGDYPFGSVYVFDLRYPLSYNPIQVEKRIYDAEEDITYHYFSQVQAY